MKQRTFRAAPPSIPLPEFVLKNKPDTDKADDGTQQLAASKISLDLLEEVPGRRRKLTEEQFNELVENLSNNPLVSPVTCRRLPDGRLEIISGHNRVAAYRELERTEIDVHIVDLDEDEVERAAFYANLLSNELPDYHKYLGFKARMLATGKNQKEVAEEAGINPSIVSKLMAFEKLPSVAIKVIEDHPEKFGSTNIFDIAKLAEKHKPELIAAALEKMATEEFTAKQAIAHIKEKNKPPSSMEDDKKGSHETVTIRRGKSTFCSIRKTGNNVRLEFSDAAAANALKLEIEKLIERYASQNPEIPMETD